MPAGVYIRTEEARQKIKEGLLRRKERLGYVNSPEARKKIGEALSKRYASGEMRQIKGNKNPCWKGDKICYSGLHHWIENFLGKPSKCEHCGKTGKYFYRKNGRKQWTIEWANKDHKYKRNLNDWLGLCRYCHGKYDQKLGLRRHIA